MRVDARAERGDLDPAARPFEGAEDPEQLAQRGDARRAVGRAPGRRTGSGDVARAREAQLVAGTQLDQQLREQAVLAQARFAQRAKALRGRRGAGSGGLRSRLAPDPARERREQLARVALVAAVQEMGAGPDRPQRGIRARGVADRQARAPAEDRRIRS